MQAQITAEREVGGHAALNMESTVPAGNTLYKVDGKASVEMQVVQNNDASFLDFRDVDRSA